MRLLLPVLSKSAVKWLPRLSTEVAEVNNEMTVITTTPAQLTPLVAGTFHHQLMQHVSTHRNKQHNKRLMSRFIFSSTALSVCRCG